MRYLLALAVLCALAVPVLAQGDENPVLCPMPPPGTIVAEVCPDTPTPTATRSFETPPEPPVWRLSLPVVRRA